ncbi:hypothetical protein PoB_007191900 [Plakobranchus ocellatus]|uniref:Uncharacterized protein n=1 Tax=Plakobranchus ocellatus TaxID=259542 RepID=A0AAV4DML5_9GAST|nr:hypothetical protein PoB_007191900 [Plakobranchus ocellatus]
MIFSPLGQNNGYVYGCPSVSPRPGKEHALTSTRSAAPNSTLIILTTPPALQKISLIAFMACQEGKDNQRAIYALLYTYGSLDSW